MASGFENNENLKSKAPALILACPDELKGIRTYDLTELGLRPVGGGYGSYEKGGKGGRGPPPGLQYGKGYGNQYEGWKVIVIEVVTLKQNIFAQGFTGR